MVDSLGGYFIAKKSFFCEISYFQVTLIGFFYFVNEVEQEENVFLPMTALNKQGSQ
jgi:hypothetical protein